MKMKARGPENVSARSCARLLDEAGQYLRFLRHLGLSGIGAGQKARRIVSDWEGRPGASTAGDLGVIAQEIRNCRRCRLADERRGVVFGHGDPRARLMFIGPFPEPGDAETGIPYSGEAGALLTRIIEAIGQSRDSVYICHAVKCRPESDRVPERFEAHACRVYLERQIRSISPELIIVLGGFAAQSLLRTDMPISRLRGEFHDYAGTYVMPTHEPAYLMVNPAAKRAVWEDMKKVMARISH